MLKFGSTKDIDVWPIFFPFQAGWAFLPSGAELVAGTAYENQQRLLAGEIDVALITPLVYAQNQPALYLLPTPVRASDLSSDAITIISKKRPDQFEKPIVAGGPSSQMGQVLLKLVGSRYFGFEPEFKTVESEAIALESLNNGSDICILSGEAGLKASRAALERGYFAEDLTKAWWILTGVPLPLGLFGLRRQWVETNQSEAESLIRKLIQSLRTALQHSREQQATLCQQAAKQSGLEIAALEAHFRQQRYELREVQLRGLFEFYRRASDAGLCPVVKDLALFPELSDSPKISTTPALKALIPLETLPIPNQSSKNPTAPREQAQAQGLRVIKGGKPDKPAPTKPRSAPRPASKPKEVTDTSKE